jgi:phage portal protein BeeE
VRGKIDELIPIEPGRVTPRQNADLSITYSVRGLDGKSQDFPQEAIWHVRGPSWNTWVGMDFLRIAREALGLTMAIEADQAQLYKNGLRTSGTYSVEGELTEPQYDQLRKFIKDFQASDEGGPLILDRAAKFVNQTMTGVDAQTIESRKLQIEEICRASAGDADHGGPCRLDVAHLRLCRTVLHRARRAHAAAVVPPHRDFDRTRT